MGENKSSSTQHTEPFTGAMLGKYNNFLDTTQNRYNNNSYTNGLAQFNGQTGDTSSYDFAKAYGNNMVNNNTLTNMAQGNNLDPTSDKNFMKALDYSNQAIQKAGAKGFDKINALNQTSGFGKNSSMWQNMQQQNIADTQDAIGKNISNALSQQYQQNINNMFNANTQVQGFANYLRQQGLDTYNMSDNELNRALNLYKTQVGMDDQSYQELASAIKMGSNPTTNSEQTTSSNDWMGSMLGLGTSIYGGTHGWYKK